MSWLWKLKLQPKLTIWRINLWFSHKSHSRSSSGRHLTKPLIGSHKFSPFRRFSCVDYIIIIIWKCIIELIFGLTKVQIDLAMFREIQCTPNWIHKTYVQCARYLCSGCFHSFEYQRLLQRTRFINLMNTIKWTLQVRMLLKQTLELISIPWIQNIDLSFFTSTLYLSIFRQLWSKYVYREHFIILAG